MIFLVYLYILRKINYRKISKYVKMGSALKKLKQFKK